MTVTSTDFKTNLGKYLDLVDSEDIVITRNGRSVAKLVKTENNKLNVLRSLYGILADSEMASMSDEEIKETIMEERFKRNDCVN